MKDLLLLLAIAALTCTSSYAQGTITNGQMTHEKQTHQAISLKMDIPTDESKDYFNDFMKERYEVKVDGLGFLKNKDELVIEEAEIALLSTKKIDLFVDFADKNDDVTSVLFAGRFSNEIFFGDDTEPEMFEKLNKLLNDYRLYAQEKHFSMLLESQNEKQEDLMKDLENATEDIAKNKKDIEKNLEENEKMKKENISLEKDSKELKMKLEELKSKITESKNSLQNIK